MPEYEADSPNWEAWFALEHEEQWRRGVLHHHANPVPPPIVKPEDEEDEAAYQEALAEGTPSSWRGVRPQQQLRRPHSR